MQAIECSIVAWSEDKHKYTPEVSNFHHKGLAEGKMSSFALLMEETLQTGIKQCHCLQK